MEVNLLNANVRVEPSFSGMPDDILGVMLSCMDGDMIFDCVQLCKPLRDSIVRLLQKPGFVVNNVHQYMMDEAYFFFKRLKIGMNLKEERVYHEEPFFYFEFKYKERRGWSEEKEQEHTAQGYRTLLNGKEHSFDDKPSFDANYVQRWSIYGYTHRPGDLPAIMRENRCYAWYKKGVLHRKNLPAYITYMDILFFEDGVLHRGGGLPAIMCGHGLHKWYEHGVFIRENPHCGESHVYDLICSVYNSLSSRPYWIF